MMVHQMLKLGLRLPQQTRLIQRLSARSTTLRLARLFKDTLLPRLFLFERLLMRALGFF